MPRLSKAHDHARRRLLDLAAGGYSVERLGRLVMETLQDAVGWDGYRLFGLDRHTQLVNRLLAASENDTDARLEFLREVYLQLDMLYGEIPEIARRGHKAVALQDLQHECWGYPLDDLSLVHPADHYRHYHEMQSPVGGAAIGIFCNGTYNVAAFQAYRRDAKRRFRASEITFMNLVQPIIGRALAAALQREQAMIATAEDSPSGILMVERSGRIRFATPSGEQWLHRLGSDGHMIPTGVWSAMAHLRSRERPVSSVVTLPTPGAAVRIEATPTGEDGVTAIVIARIEPPKPPEVPVTWGLTPQERQVVQELAAGKSNRELAETLFIGEHTVEWHLKKVFDKVGVRSRQELITLLFRQVFLPGVEARERMHAIA
jgi:DNA-binding CsgD family transcriptional regulator